MNPWAILGALLAWLGSLAGAGWWMYTAGRDSVVAKQAVEDRAIAAASEAAASAAASAISRLKVQNTTIQQEVQRVVSEVPVYRDCRNDPRIMQSINAALTGAEPAGGGIVRPADTAP